MVSSVLSVFMVNVVYAYEWKFKEHINHKYFPHINYPTAYYEDNIIFPYQASDGNVKVDIIDYDTLTVLNTYTIGVDPFPTDAHAKPSIIKFGSYYVTLYGQHGMTGGTLKVGYSTNLETWNTYNFPSGYWSYPQLWVFGNKLYLCLRESVTATHTRDKWFETDSITSVASWVDKGILIDYGNNVAPYNLVRLINKNQRLGLVWAFYFYNGSPTYFGEVLHFAYTDNMINFYNKSGNSVSLPFDDGTTLLYTKAGYEINLAVDIEGFGDTIWTSVRWREETVTPSNDVVIEQVIGGSQTVYQLDWKGSGSVMFYLKNYNKVVGYGIVDTDYDTFGDNIIVYEIDVSSHVIETDYNFNSFSSSYFSSRDIGKVFNAENTFSVMVSTWKTSISYDDNVNSIFLIKNMVEVNGFGLGILSELMPTIITLAVMVMMLGMLDKMGEQL